jgi:predicted lipid-binding transport protein (Tim44 family)
MIADDGIFREHTMAPGGEAFDPALIVFGALAIFIIWKLRSVLGVRIDREGPPQTRFEPHQPMARESARISSAPVVTSGDPRGAAQTWQDVAETVAARAGLDAVAAADRNFDGLQFLEGARRAYEMIVEAFARGDRDALQPLLSKESFDGFATEITRREAAGEKLETAVVAIDSAKVVDAHAQPGRIDVTVRFEARVQMTRRDRAGEVIDGGRTLPIIESWTFARDPRASDPNWKLVATQPAD